MGTAGLSTIMQRSTLTQQLNFLRRNVVSSPRLLLLGLVALLIVTLTPLQLHAQTPRAATQVHPLPTMLANFQPAEDTSDYFKQIKPLPLGYLVWSKFPVSVYVHPSQFSDQARSQAWEQGTRTAIADWQQYFPLVIVDRADADIVIEQVRPRKRSGGRARSAQASPKAYCGNNYLAHQFKIQISPSQTGQYIQAATKHEIGHALGLWGHSLSSSDVMYAAQTATPPTISDRDLNTLRQVYQQPTLLGWSAPKYCPQHS